MLNLEGLLISLIAVMATDLVPVKRASDNVIPKLVRRTAVTPA